ncbi:ABC transporter permease [Rhodopirellula europaea]|jgi:putative ABC transport system permease protein|uniref:ABC transporter, permease protein n=1 Tax=Rhodopirellula europaea SH398 TaxID=1263868 RepID=M5RYQ1_9BACT|nr:ABC transporter permease [Rhodopirellula europaea]EMI24321.1 ABC transporter, permease protein [Rhodopirellula europaea SH398]MCR9210100.1 ABC transporter permease [bacterium]
MNLATKDIRHNLGRFALTSLGIGMLLMVVMGMGGIYRGVVEDATLLIDRVDADLWIVQRDTRGPFAELSRVPSNLVYRAAAVPGVEFAREFVYHTIQRQRDDKPLRIAVLGLSWPTDKGEWVPLKSGRPLGQAHFEMVADQSLGFALGESIELGKDTFTVVGITENMISSSGDGLAFFTVADALAIQFDTPGEAVRLERAARQSRGERFDLAIQQPMMLENAWKPTAQLPAVARPQISAVMVTLSGGANVDEVAETISGWGDVSVFTAEGQRELLLRGSVEKVRRQIGLFRVLLTIIAAIIMALILYTLTLDKIHSIALLKLIGAPNTVILGMILQQAIVLGVVGFAIAYLVGQQLFPLFPRRVILDDGDLIQLAAIVIGISILSSLLGIWKAFQVSPNEALA